MGKTTNLNWCRISAINSSTFSGSQHFLAKKWRMNVWVFFFPPNRWKCHCGHGCIDVPKNVDLPCRKLRWQWNISIFNRRYIFKGLVFHCQLSFFKVCFLCLQVVRAGWRVHVNCLPWWSRTAHQDLHEAWGKSCESPLLNGSLGGGFKYFLFSPLFGEDFQFD